MPQKQAPINQFSKDLIDKIEDEIYLEDVSNIEVPKSDKPTEAEKFMGSISPDLKEQQISKLPSAVHLLRRHSIDSGIPISDDNKITSGEFDTNFPQSSAINNLGPTILRSLPAHQPDSEALRLAIDKAKDRLRASRSLPESGFNDLLEKDSTYISSPKREDEIKKISNLSDKFLEENEDVARRLKLTSLQSVSPIPSSPQLSPEEFRPNYLNDSSYLLMLRSAELASLSMEFQSQEDEANTNASSPERLPSREYFSVYESLSNKLIANYSWSTISEPARSSSPISIDLDKKPRALSAPPSSAPSLSEEAKLGQEIVKVGKSFSLARQ
ncbi:MAG: hypothetical protein ACO26G_01115 [Rickettsiales bacterium]